jgi:uncharacterized protein (TIGR02246 family)
MRRILSLSALALLLGAVAYGALNQTRQPKINRDETQIRAVLNSTADGWNKGDLQQYLSAYTETATEMGANGPEGGKSAIERTMRQGFWKTGRPLQNLRYEHLEVRMLGKDHALVTGQFILSGGQRPNRTGWFTTVWERTRQGWRMIHDHS